MSMPNDDQYEDYEDDQPQRRTGKDLRAEVQSLTAERDQLKAAAERAAVLERENAVFKANLGNLNEAQQAAVLATAKEISADALRSQAELLGFIAAPEPAVPVADLEAFDRVSAAQAAGQQPDAASYEAEIGAAKDEAEVFAIMAKYNKPLATYD